MPQAIKSTPDRIHLFYRCIIQPNKQFACKAFSLVEVLVALVIFAVAASASIVIFGGSMRQIYRTSGQADANAAIESDIAKIKQMAEAYTACVDPAGSIPSTDENPCSAKWPDGVNPVTMGDAWYYYPDPANKAAVTKFESACTASSGSANPPHITKNLIDLINDQTVLTKADLAAVGVTRSDATRENSAVFSNYVILVRYTKTSGNIDRLQKIVPVVSAWCP